MELGSKSVFVLVGCGALVLVSVGAGEADCVTLGVVVSVWNIYLGTN